MSYFRSFQTVHDVKTQRICYPSEINHFFVSPSPFILQAQGAHENRHAIQDNQDKLSGGRNSSYKDQSLPIIKCMCNFCHTMRIWCYWETIEENCICLQNRQFYEIWINIFQHMSNLKQER
jgi:hypothetical protein